jgi:hypothetical protein
VNCTRKFNRTKRHLLYMVRDPKRFTFNRAAVSTLSDRQKKYNDKRANPAGKVLDDVWIYPGSPARTVSESRECLRSCPWSSYAALSVALEPRRLSA